MVIMNPAQLEATTECSSDMSYTASRALFIGAVNQQEHLISLPKIAPLWGDVEAWFGI